MSGRWVVALMLVGVAGFGSVAWGLGLRTKWEMDARAEALGVRRMSRQEAAELVARQDKFGLGSRLEDAPERDIEHYLRVGSRAEPIPTTPEGMALLLVARKATFENCAKLTHAELDEGQKTVKAEIVIGHADELGAVGSVTVLEEGSAAWTSYGECVYRLLQPLVFASPGDAPYKVVLDLPVHR